MQPRFFILFTSMFFLLSCADESSSGPAKENSSSSHGSEIVCDIGNEGMIVKPADGEMERICKGGSWLVIESSSSGNLMVSSDAKENQSSSSSFIESEVKQSSSSNITALSSSEGLSGSSVVQSSDSHEGSQSSSSDYAEESSSSSDDTKLYLCDDGVTYVLDLANCKVESSSSESGTPESSSDNEESSSSRIESSSSIGMSSSSVSSSLEESSSSVNSVYDAQNNTLTDLRDNRVYKTVTIGTQVWMAENLNYLPEDTVGTFFVGLTVCGGGKYRSLEEGDCSVFGRLYDVKIFAPPNEFGYEQDLCPDGWSIPNLKQWNVLIEFLGEDVAGKKMKLNDKDKTYWPNSEATNEYGFSAIPSGFYARDYGFNKYDSNTTAVFMIKYKSSNLFSPSGIHVVDTTDRVIRAGFYPGFCVAVRCLKN